MCLFPLKKVHGTPDGRCAGLHDLGGSLYGSGLIKFVFCHLETIFFIMKELNKPRSGYDPKAKPALCVTFFKEFQLCQLVTHTTLALLNGSFFAAAAASKS